MKWTKRKYALYGLRRKLAVPHWRWTSGNLCILSPSDLSEGLYEFYHGKDIYRFSTLKEAKAKAEQLNNQKS